MLKLQGIHHVAVLSSVELYDASKQFYTEVLGFTIVRETYRAERNSWKLDLALNGVYQVELFSFPDFRERASHPEAKGLRHLAFSTADVEAAYRWLLQQGVRTETVRTDELTAKKFVFFYDPNGQPLELYETGV